MPAFSAVTLRAYVMLQRILSSKLAELGICTAFNQDTIPQIWKDLVQSPLSSAELCTSRNVVSKA